MTQEEYEQLPKTSRGFLLLLPLRKDRDGHGLKVVESSLAGCGAHVRIFVDEGDGVVRGLHLSVEDAAALVRALSTFIDAAESGLLIEPADPPSTDG